MGPKENTSEEDQDLTGAEIQEMFDDFIGEETETDDSDESS